MNQCERRLRTFAARIHNKLNDQASAAEEPVLPTSAWTRIQRFHQTLMIAQAYELSLASERLRKDLRGSVSQFREELRSLERKLSQPALSAASASEIYADLQCLDNEFDEVELNGRSSIVKVQTEPIVPEGIDLGRFEIVVCWIKHGTRQVLRYHVVALDPNPAASNECVTHPHVQDGYVCEGEGAEAIQAALEEGRILDLCLIVFGILRTYNADSPYVSLADWQGVPCGDCGSMLLEEDWYRCTRCETQICFDCSIRCLTCDYDFCCECTTVCECCGDRACDSCITACPDCDMTFCPNCLTETERCPDCHENENEEDGCEPDPDPEVHTDGVGEAAVSA